MKYVFVNEQFVAEEKAALKISDLCIQRGYAIFDFFRLRGNTPLFLDDHLDRFYYSAAEMKLDAGRSREALKAIIHELIEKNDLPGTGIRITLTGGYSEDGISIATPNLILSQHSFQAPSEQKLARGIHLASYKHQRQLPSVKTIDYLMAVRLNNFMNQLGADDLLYYSDESISESPRSNFFIVTEDETLVTPGTNILRGITRMKVLELAHKHFRVEERPVRLEELKTAKEAFITSTTKQLLPVARVDDYHFQERKVTTKLQQLFNGMTEVLFPKASASLPNPL